MSSSNLLHSREHRTLVVTPSSLLHAVHIPLRFPAERFKGLHLCRHKQLAIDLGKIQRLDSVAVTSSNENLQPRIVQADGKLSAQVFKERQSVSFVECDDDFAVTLAFELGISIFDQLFSDKVRVVKLSIDNSVNMAVRRMKRLLAVRAQVVDCEAYMS